MRLFSIQALFYLFVLMWDKNNSTLGQECGAVVNNTLTSPGYPNHYPPDKHCTYWIPIPDGTKLIIRFEEFYLFHPWRGPCNGDYLKVDNETDHSFGVYCGDKTGETVEVIGDYAVITFHSSYYSFRGKRFLISFRVKSSGSNSTTIAAPNVVFPAPTIRDKYPGDRLSCSATGTPPINIAIMNDSATLVNASNTASIRVYEDGNYTCQASSKYGNDTRHILVDLIANTPAPAPASTLAPSRRFTNTQRQERTDKPTELPRSSKEEFDR